MVRILTRSPLPSLPPVLMMGGGPDAAAEPPPAAQEPEVGPPPGDGPELGGPRASVLGMPAPAPLLGSSAGFAAAEYSRPT